MPIDFNTDLPEYKPKSPPDVQHFQVPQNLPEGTLPVGAPVYVTIHNHQSGSKFRSNFAKFALGIGLVLGGIEAWDQAAKSPRAQKRVESIFGADKYIKPIGVSPSTIIAGLLQENQGGPAPVPVPGPEMLEKLSDKQDFSFVAVGDNTSVELPTSTTHPYFLAYQQCALDGARFGIPPSIKLMQGFLEGNAGKSRLAKNGNNHFGMKYGTVTTILQAAQIMKLYVPTIKDPTKKQVAQEILQHVEYVRMNLNGFSYHNDDDKGEKFANLNTPEAGYAAHDCLILFGTMHVASKHKDVVNYQGRYLPALLTNDYTGFAGVLKASGYATIQGYHKQLIDGINASGLQVLDKSYNPARNRVVHDVMMGYYKFLEQYRQKQGKVG